MDRNWILDFSGCDGGTIGSSKNPAIWICGIEWGGGTDIEGLKNFINQKWDSSPDFGYDDVKDLDFYPYNRIVYKLLAVMKGYPIDDYKMFSQTEKPFVHNSHSSYFKMNLYPIPFINTDHSNWENGISKLTGFNSKQDYIDWCHENRFPVMKQWVQKYSPKMIICFGKTYTEEFNLAFSDNNEPFVIEPIEDIVLQWKKNNNGTIIAVLPFPNAVNNGLKKNTSIELAGKRLAELSQ